MKEDTLVKEVSYIYSHHNLSSENTIMKNSRSILSQENLVLIVEKSNMSIKRHLNKLGFIKQQHDVFYEMI